MATHPASPTAGADWGSIPVSVDDEPDAGIAFTSTKAQDLTQPLVVAQIPFKI